MVLRLSAHIDSKNSINDFAVCHNRLRMVLGR
jgi:hypothetical protein